MRGLNVSNKFYFKTNKKIPSFYSGIESKFIWRRKKIDHFSNIFAILSVFFVFFFLASTFSNSILCTKEKTVKLKLLIPLVIISKIEKSHESISISIGLKLYSLITSDFVATPFTGKMENKNRLKYISIQLSVSFIFFWNFTSSFFFLHHYNWLRFSKIPPRKKKEREWEREKKAKFNRKR